MAELNLKKESRLLSNVFRTISGIREDKLFPANPAASMPPLKGKAKRLEAKNCLW
jgi:hypothetical protein